MKITESKVLCSLSSGTSGKWPEYRHMLSWVFGFLLSSCQSPSPLLDATTGIDVGALEGANRTLGGDESPLLLAPESLPILGSSESWPRWPVLGLNAGLPRPVTAEDLLIFPDEKSAPGKGRCVFFGLSPASVSGESVVFLGNSSSSAKDKSRYFFLRSAEGALSLGVGLLDDEGRAYCELPRGRWALTHEGLSRELQSGNREVVFPLPARGTFLVSSGSEEGALPGDVLRLGRLNASFGSDLLAMDAADGLERDLFRSLTSRDLSFGARDALITSWLVSDAPLSLQLEAGPYVAVLFRAREITPCVAKLSIPAGGEARLRCPRPERTELGPMHDESIFPYPLQTSQAFSRFLRQREGSPGGSPISATGSLFPAGRFEALGADGAPNPVSHCEELAQSMNRGELPVMSTGLSALTRGATPFLAGWRALQSQGRLSAELASYFAMGNGVDFRPVSFAGNPLTSVPPQHRFRVSVEIPAGNATDTMAFLIDGKEWRRKALPRGAADAPLALEVDELISRKDDFYLNFCAWGNRYQSELLSGVPRALPFAISRSMCVDADDDGRCSAR